MSGRMNALCWALLLLASLKRQADAFEVSDTGAGPLMSGRAAHSLLDNGIVRSLRHMYAQCADSEDIFWCGKLQAVKLLGRALKVSHINILEGVAIVKKLENETRSGRAHHMHSGQLHLTNHDVEQLSMKSLDALLLERFGRFMRSRQVQVNLPRLLAMGRQNGQSLWAWLQEWAGPALTLASDMGELDAGPGMEGRKKKDKKYLGAFVAAVMLKAAILKMAYHSIAIIAGKALIVGKIALIISAIIGLKKLVGGEGGEKTTYEIVKHPHVSQSHTYSSSHGGEYESGHEGGAYHRSIDDEMVMQDKAYSAWVPTRTP